MRRRRMLRIGRDERGAALVEFSLVAPILLSLTFGVIQYGLLLYTYNNMLNAARETARSVAIGSVKAAAAPDFAKTMLVTWPAPWTVTADDKVKINGDDHVRLTISTPSSKAAIINLVPMPATLTAQVTMRIEK
ncbi:TadE/TadG family type IV pilus assembly protein [Caulobacter sp. 17J80-11]|uniref:TadE/TadG family type IV pilus assembly protein n=1 Tax=Caulobacter sp. 17J80-11 TaxID=2763502 RepID=UPI001653D73F|nr:TadE family protein [Caulobacter sp. 17J80-11]MBC6981557.1 pilus assembly protein [Caulobacter sp. 17J80-11]